jgi:hypothetical protein
MKAINGGNGQYQCGVISNGNNRNIQWQYQCVCNVNVICSNGVINNENINRMAALYQLEAKAWRNHVAKMSMAKWRNQWRNNNGNGRKYNQINNNI